MSHEAAKKIIDVLIKHGKEQNQLLIDIEATCSKEEFARYRKMIGKSMGSMLLDVINPIIRIYPDLKPPQLE